MDNAIFLFQHGYDNYMQHAWPLDELNPLACCGRGEYFKYFSPQHYQCSGPDTENPDNININDVLGDFSLTLIDSLDTLAGIIYLDVKCRLYCVICSILVMGNASEFRRAVRLVVDTVHFDKSNTVQVFLFSLIKDFKFQVSRFLKQT